MQEDKYEGRRSKVPRIAAAAACVASLAPSVLSCVVAAANVVVVDGFTDRVVQCSQWIHILR